MSSEPTMSYRVQRSEIEISHEHLRTHDEIFSPMEKMTKTS
jgi:hypothetical protein